MDAGEPLRGGQRASGRAGRDDQPSKSEATAIVEQDAAPDRIERAGADPEPPIDAEIVITLASQREPIFLPLALQELLREGWSIVGSMRLCTDRNDLARVAASSQRFDGAQTGERPAHDDDSL